MWAKYRMEKVCYLVLLVLNFALCIWGRDYCHDIQDRCYSRLSCGHALYNFQVVCQRQLHGDMKQCSNDCKRALISLVSTEEGYDFITCECKVEDRNYSDCEDKKRAMQVCTNDVLNAVQSLKNSSKVISCSLAYWLCEAESPCFTALEYYTSHCGNLKKRDKCSQRCNNSINILYQQSKALKLQNCVCDDDSKAFNCKELQFYTKKLCFNQVGQDMVYRLNPKRSEQVDYSAASYVCPISYRSIFFFLLLIVYILI